MSYGGGYGSRGGGGGGGYSGGGHSNGYGGSGYVSYLSAFFSRFVLVPLSPPGYL